ncbi:NERD domain-containing protein [Pseudonocardia sp. C8]|uniref:nuclease-related domain-containing protein n=1 Tax=Pseudonocardia sp. C8 TaxID=2762759 RepID=UPI001642A945|nr:nuclease-related domain-containing protein [Pseudonocardia sp. C8]MBC3194734.1 NERD domain-containing protein [Pseudonocardia sp. C8]
MTRTDETVDRSRTLDLARHYPGRRAGHVAAHVRGAGGPDRNWRLGADGELRTAQLLASLTGRTRRDRLLGRPPRWRVLHSVPLDGGAADLDHVLVGPPGICVINSRHHRRRPVLLDGDRLVVSGVSTDAVPRARLEAQRVRELLLPRLGADGARVPVRPVIAVIGAPMRVRRWPDDVVVATEGALVHALRGLAAVLDPAEVERIHGVARRPEAWT